MAVTEVDDPGGRRVGREVVGYLPLRSLVFSGTHMTRTKFTLVAQGHEIVTSPAGLASRLACRASRRACRAVGQPEVVVGLFLPG
jgi:hypothetical protein